MLTGKPFAMLRLEDIGPGGAYSTMEDLGRLRAIFAYLHKEQVPFHIAVIPHWKTLHEDGTWYEKSLDDPQSDNYIKRFIQLLHQGVNLGGIPGMHGYTHQYGNWKQENNNQDSALGFEFNVKNAPETDRAEYGAERIARSMAAFHKIGIRPGFWESPHYLHTLEQEKVFQSYIGVIYQSDVTGHATTDLYVNEEENLYGHPTMGSVFIPTPLDYISEENTVEDVLLKLSSFQGLASMFFHPFLEYPYLEAVNDTTGKTFIHDGLPVYNYKGEDSPLHRLICGFRKQGYQWISLYERIPFIPAYRVDVPRGTRGSDLLFGDVRGVGHQDVVIRDNHRILIIPGTYQLPRNRPQEMAQVWLEKDVSPDELLLLADINGDKKDDLLLYNRHNSKIRVFYSTGKGFRHDFTSHLIPQGLDSLQVFRQKNRIDLIGRRGNRLFILVNRGGGWETIQSHLKIPDQATWFIGDINGDLYDEVMFFTPSEKAVYIYPIRSRMPSSQCYRLPLPIQDEGEQVLIGDTNGDGKDEIIIYHPKAGLWRVIQWDGSFQIRESQVPFGPWARGKHFIGVADFDGNGKGDLVAFDEKRFLLDIALSF